MADLLLSTVNRPPPALHLPNRRQDANTIVDSYTGTYYLTSHIHVRNNATLEIDGDHPDDGDCEILLMVGKNIS